MDFNVILVFAVFTVLQATLAACGDVMVKQPVIQPYVCECEYDFAPACGSDGITYPNECVLNCYSKMGVKKGKSAVTLCTDGITCNTCRCPAYSLPVCSMDGKTYPNECELSCENYRRSQSDRPLVYLAYRAPCLGTPSGCSTIASPVCGSDNILYRNLCVLNCANENAVDNDLSPIEFKNVGACLEACACPDIDDPVCGSDGNEYCNLCQIACKNRKQTCSLSGPVVPAPSRTCEACTCPAIYNPVCASDGKMEPRTFLNPCEVTCEAKRTNNPFLYPLGFGVCPTCFCTEQYLPVCGTDCKTYKNECELRCANDARPKGETEISVFHSGTCQVAEDCDCSRCETEYLPVCGDDGVTYWNLCWMKCNSNCSKRLSGKEIYLTAKGSCRL